MRYVSAEGGGFPFDFDQRESSPDVPPVIIQGLLVTAGRERRVKVPPGACETAIGANKTIADFRGFGDG